MQLPLLDPNAEVPPQVAVVTISNLIVSGNESLPNGQPNAWNSRRSKQLLRLISEEPVSDSDDDANEYSQRSRARRIRLAKALGVTKSQLNFAQLSL